MAGLIPGSYRVRAASGGGFVDELFDGISCVLGCDPVTGSAVVVNTGADTGGVDFALQTSAIFTDGFESGDLASWSAAVN